MASRIHIFITGSVQGVFFRATTQEKARELGLTGWVRNLPDGRVEVLAEGDEEKLKDLLEWCRGGPSESGACVDSVEEEWGGASGKFTLFSVRN